MDPAQSASDREFPRPDAAFAFACGLYTASVITPITAILAQAAVTGTGRLVLAVLSIGTALVAVGTVGTTRLPGLPEYLGATPWAWLLVVAPLVGTASVLASAALPSVAVARSTTVVVGLAGLGSAFAGLAVVATATTRHTAWVLADATVEATWTAGWPTRARRRLWTIAGMVVLVGAGTFVVGSLREQYLVELAGQVLVPVGLVTATAGRRVTYRATERGLELRTPLARRLLPWSAFDGYRRTDDAIVLSRSAPWRVSIRCAVDDVADPETVLRHSPPTSIGSRDGSFIRVRVAHSRVSEPVPTGCGPVDELLGGGFERGAVTQIYGPPAAGKTNLVLSAAVETTARGESALYVDTEGLSVDRMEQVLAARVEAADEDADELASRLIITDALTFEEQREAVQDAAEFAAQVELIVLDSATGFYRLERTEQAEGEALRAVARQITHLLGLARKHDLAVAFTNQVYTDPESDGISALGGHTLNHWSSAVLRLDRFRGGNRRATLEKHQSREAGETAQFKITDAGLAAGGRGP